MLIFNALQMPLSISAKIETITDMMYLQTLILIIFYKYSVPFNCQYCMLVCSYCYPFFFLLYYIDYVTNLDYVVILRVLIKMIITVTKAKANTYHLKTSYL